MITYTHPTSRIGVFQPIPLNQCIFPYSLELIFDEISDRGKRHTIIVEVSK
jgi:hypothetical protein